MTTSQVLEDPIRTQVDSAPSAKTRVTYIVGGLKNGGAERQVVELIRNLNRNQFSPSIILMEGDNSERIRSWVEDCIVLGIPQGGNSRWFGRVISLSKAVLRTRTALKAWKTDVVHAVLPGPSIIGGMAARMAGVPIMIGSRHSLVSFYRAHGGWTVNLVDRCAFYLADVTLGPSQAVTREMVTYGGCPGNRCRTIYNGVDTNRFRPSQGSSWREEMGWSDGEVGIGMIANFRVSKGHADFVRAVAILAPRNPQARFVMMGTDLGLRKEIEAQVRDLGLTSRICILDGGPFPEKVLVALDICLCPSTSEAFSLVAAEAMACGKPVVATNVGGIPEVVKHGETGFLVPSSSPMEIAAAVERLLQDSELRRKMGERGRQRVVGNFSVRKMVEEHESLYRELLNRKRVAA